jgi:hypothetical protein
LQEQPAYSSIVKIKMKVIINANWENCIDNPQKKGIKTKKKLETLGIKD